MVLKMGCASRTPLEYKTPESNKSVIDMGLQRLLARGRRPIAAGEQAEAFAEPISDLAHRYGPRPGGRQLQCERQAL